MMNPHTQQRPGKEQGSVLLITMVFLLLFAIVATTVFRSSQTSVQAVGNMQWRTEAINASNEVVANILSDYNGFIQPALTGKMSALDDPRRNFSSDVNGDRKADIKVNVDAVECSYVAEVKQEDLDINKAEDLACMNSANMASTTFCSEVQFSIELTASDPVTSANVQIEQGVGVRTTGVEICKN